MLALKPKPKRRGNLSLGVTSWRCASRFTKQIKVDKVLCSVLISIVLSTTLWTSPFPDGQILGVLISVPTHATQLGARKPFAYLDEQFTQLFSQRLQHGSQLTETQPTDRFTVAAYLTTLHHRDKIYVFHDNNIITLKQLTANQPQEVGPFVPCLFVNQRNLYLLLFVALRSSCPPAEYSLCSGQLLFLLTYPLQVFGFRTLMCNDQIMKRKVQANYVGFVDLLFREISLFRQDGNKVFTRGFLCYGRTFDLAIYPTVEHHVQETDFRKPELTVLDPYLATCSRWVGRITLLSFVLTLELWKARLTLFLGEFSIFQKPRQRCPDVLLDVTQRHAVDVFEEWIFLFVMSGCWVGKLLGFIVTSFEIMQHQVPNKPGATKRLIQQISLLIIRVSSEPVGFIRHGHEV